ncbi:putative hydrolase of the HAD superfamily [Saccharicrinis carchari]|uniref:Putative hydrolase of the HAD superfamily n=1 Tax=Saccharicrinis carchari TaxID=1168039 RepID=A0A521CMZ0_SACCC|nr:HAD family phosphatase [Saccharicrinis carchari]SMO60814.1 putative hydrolase of the HAD superfamily [Saccharicrinis carchari]
MSNLHNKKNILFDLGNVVIDIDLNITLQRFKELGYEFDGDSSGIFQKSPFFKEFEEGRITSSEFVKSVKLKMPKNVSDNQIVDAWNALLLDYRTDRIETILKLKKTHKVILLSNTNELHIQKCGDKVPLVGSLDKLFDKVYYSHIMKMSKPNPNIFAALLKDADIKADETLFLDDSAANVTTAEQMGIESWLIEYPDQWVPKINALMGW